MESSMTGTGNLGIHNRVSGLNLCFEKLGGKLAQLMALQESLMGTNDVIFKLKTDLDDVKQRMNGILMQYDDDDDDAHDGNIMDQLKEIIIEVYKTKRSIDLAFRVFHVGVNEEKGKGLINYGESSSNADARARIEGKDLDLEFDFGKLGLLSSSTEEEESEVGVDKFEKKDGEMNMMEKLERFLGKLAQTSSSGEDIGEDVSDSELFSSNIEELDEEIKDLISKGKQTEEEK